MKGKNEKSDETGTTTPKWDYLVNGFREQVSGILNEQDDGKMQATYKKVHHLLPCNFLWMCSQIIEQLHLQLHYQSRNKQQYLVLISENTL